MSNDASAREDNNEPDSETLGSRLRAARESRDLSLDKIADELRIEENVLHALEEDRLGDLKVAPVFVKGYIKQYGRLLELDYEQLLDSFRSQSGSEDVRLRPNRVIQLRDERQITIWIIAALAVALVGVALFLWWLGDDGIPSRLFGADADDGSASVAAPVTSLALQSARDTAAAAQRAADAAPPAAEAPPAAAAVDEAVDEPVTPAAAEPAAPQTLSAPTASVDSGATEVIALAAAEPVPERVNAAEPAPGAVAMVFEFSQESWFELTDARGERLHYDLAAANSILQFMAVPPSRVIIGNVGAVNITVASRTYPVPASGLRGNVAIFTIDSAQE